MAITQPPISAYFYSLNQTVPSVDYGWQLENVKMTTMAPGGFGDFTADLYVNQSQILPPNIASFNNIAVMCGNTWIFLGRMDEPGPAMDNAQGTVIHISALGAADVLKDDPQDSAYTNQTAQAIMQDQLTGPSGAAHPRSAYLPISSDYTQILPDNPSATFSPVFTGKTIEDVLNELTNDLGDYMWGVWDHPTQKDAQGYPQWQLYAHQRNFGTANPANLVINYRVTQTDIIDFDIRPAVEYSFSSVYLIYRDPTSQNSNSVQVSDSRLNSNRTQGTATIPFRVLRKDVSEALLTSTQATSLANALLNQYKTGSYKITLTLGNIRGAYGQDIPLCSVRADNNVFVDMLTPLGSTLPAGLVKDGGLFYITETEYDETSGATPKLVVTCDTYYDGTSFQLARIQRVAHQRHKNHKKKGVVQEPNMPDKGPVSAYWGGNALSTDTYGQSINFKTTLSSAPTSISFTTTTSTNAGSPAYGTLTTTGFQFSISPAANGAGKFIGTYTTVGN